MSEGKNTLFTIGQFAALHGINKKTLMWYDEIGLFQPAVISEENGYRYYNYYQSSVLETILMLRDMKVPLADIKSFIKNRSAESMEILLKEMLMYGKEASNRKQEIDRQHYTIPNQRPKDKHCGKI